MRYRYKYHNANGEVQEGEISASSRENAFHSLQKRGIKPMYCVEIGSSGIGKRWIAIAVLSVAVVVLTVLLIWTLVEQRHERRTLGNPSERSAVEKGLAPDERIARSHARHQIGSKSLKDEVADFESAFRFRSERFLAMFAEPGSVDYAASWPDVMDEDIWDALRVDIVIRPDDSAVVAELKRIVAGMKDDVAMRLASGATVAGVSAWIRDRQEMEADYRERIISDGGKTEEQQKERLKVIGLREKTKK